MFPELTRSVWEGVIAQERAIDVLSRSVGSAVHAYLFVGPAGCTKDDAARAFAALLLTGLDDADSRDARLALAHEHPDVREFRREGARISAEQVKEIVRVSALAPVESSRKVMVLHEFHLLDAEGAARLLKSLEEPPASTVFIVLADQVPPELVTVASRCVRIDFRSIPPEVVRDVLVAEGVAPHTATVAATAAEGNIDRARLLANDPGLTERRAAFAAVPSRLDGSGNAVVTVCSELLALIDDAAGAMRAQHDVEVAELEARIAAMGERGSGRKALEDRHKRELRRHRTDELRSGLTVVASVYRDALVAGHLTRPDSVVHAVSRIHQAMDALERNPNEALLLQSLLLDLPSLPGR